MKILDGELQETQYHWPSSSSTDTDEVPVVGNITDTSAAASHSLTEEGTPLAISKNTVYHPNQVTYVHGNF